MDLWEAAAKDFEARIVTRWDTPGDFAAALDVTTMQTPALDVIDSALVDVESGKTLKLMISMPPQEGKSERTTHYAALWMLQRNPNLRIAIVSYAADIARQFSAKIRDDITMFNGVEADLDLGLRLQRNSKAASRWQIASPHKGGVYAIGIGGQLTGRPVDLMLIDDPVKDMRAADSLHQSNLAWEWWQSVARPRLAPTAPVILVQTRWHESDLAGRLLAKQAEDEASDLEYFDRWRVINIPAQADHDPEKGQVDPLGREPGEFMISARGRTLPQWEATKNATMARLWSAMYQGKPSPDTGDVWKREWWRCYDHMMWTVTDDVYTVDCDEMIMSWDMTFKDTKASDFVVGQVWCRKGANVYLLDQVRKRMSFTDSLAAFQRMVKKWPQCRAKLVEDKANGTAIIDMLKAKIPGIVPISPHESKVARARAVSPFIESGNVFLPERKIALFDVEEFVEETVAFPNGTHDDQVDGTSQALDRLFIGSSGQGQAFIEALKRRAERTGQTLPTQTPWRERLANQQKAGTGGHPRRVQQQLPGGEVREDS